MISFMVSVFLSCSGKETEILEVIEVEIPEKKDLLTDSSSLDLDKVETVEDYSMNYNNFEKSIKILRHDKVQVEIFETIKSPMLLNTNKAKKADLYKWHSVKASKVTLLAFNCNIDTIKL